MLATKIEDAKREEGFTLIELLVVVIIIGILAAIAIPIFLNQRESAWQGSVESDVRNAAIDVETASTQSGGDAPALTDIGDVVRSSTDVSLYYRTTTSGFEICGEHENLNDPRESITYNSQTGGLAADWSGTACSFTTEMSYVN